MKAFRKTPLYRANEAHISALTVSVTEPVCKWGLHVGTLMDLLSARWWAYWVNEGHHSCSRRKAAFASLSRLSQVFLAEKDFLNSYPLLMHFTTSSCSDQALLFPVEPGHHLVVMKGWIYSLWFLIWAQFSSCCPKPYRFFFCSWLNNVEFINKYIWQNSVQNFCTEL